MTQIKKACDWCISLKPLNCATKKRGLENNVESDYERNYSYDCN